MSDHIANLTRSAARLLASMLIAPGWYEDGITAARACAILEMPEFDQDPGERKDGSAELESWSAEPVVVTLTERQRDTIKSCIEKHAKRGAMPLGKAAGAIFRAFGFEPKDG